MDIQTLVVALGYTKKQVEEAKREGFRVQVEQDRSILETTGEEKVFYFLPKNPQKAKDGYDEFIYTNNAWEQVGVTDVDLSAYALKSEIPTKVSQLQNDSGYLIQHQDISSKADKSTTLSGYGITDAYTKAEIDTKLSAVYKYKGTVATYQDLPSSNLTNGDVYNVETDGSNYAWTGSAWDKLGGDYVLTIQDKTDIANIVLQLLPNADIMSFPLQSEVVNE